MLKSIGLGLLFIICAVEITAEPYPLDYWARRDAISGVSLSPDGSKFALMRILERGGNPIIEIYDSDNLDKEPERIDADPMEFLPGVTWIDNDIFIFSARQQVREIIEGFNRGTYEYKNGIYDTSKRKLGQIRQDYFSVVGLLPDKPNKILVSTLEGVPDGMQAIANAIRPRAYWEYDTKRNRKKLLMRGKISLGNIRFDRDGNAITAVGFDRGSDEFVYYWRPAGTKDWEEMYRIHEDSFEDFGVAGPDPAAENHFYVVAHNGYDKRGIWSYDAKNKKFSDLIYRRNDVDAGGFLYHSNRLANTDDITGISWCKDKCYREFFDASEKPLHTNLRHYYPMQTGFGSRTVTRRQHTHRKKHWTPGSWHLLPNPKR